MASNCLALCSRSPLASMPSTSSFSSSQPCPSSFAPLTFYRCYSQLMPFLVPQRKVMMMKFAINCKAKRHLVRMAPEEEKLTRRNPLDFPLEWERPKPGRRPDIFPQFSPMKTPLPPPMPYDPPEEDEEEEEKKEEEEDEEEDTEKEDPNKPENQ